MEYEPIVDAEQVVETAPKSKIVNRAKLAGCLVLGSLFYIMDIDTLSPSATRLLGTFLSLIAALIFTDYSISILVLSALAILVLTQSITCSLTNGTYIDCRNCGLECDPYNDGFKTALGGFSSSISWLILCAFHIGKAVKITGLGERISLILLKYMGGTILGLGFAIQFTELVLGAFIPSNTARGGGIVLPIVESLIFCLDSTPEYNSKIG